MGYSTDFTGELRFVHEASGSQLAMLTKILGEDCRDHPEWKADGLYHIDLELTEDFGGIKWNGSEKTYGMVEAVNLVVRLMRAQYPSFGLYGHLSAQGEEVDDRWQLEIDDHGVAQRHAVVITGTKITCPHCEQKFYLEGKATP